MNPHRYTNGPWRVEPWERCDTDGRIVKYGQRVVSARDEEVVSFASYHDGIAHVHDIAAGPDHAARADAAEEWARQLVTALSALAPRCHHCAKFPVCFYTAGDNQVVYLCASHRRSTGRSDASPLAKHLRTVLESLNARTVKK